jgi:hypothetical protein
LINVDAPNKKLKHFLETTSTSAEVIVVRGLIKVQAARRGKKRVKEQIKKSLKGLEPFKKTKMWRSPIPTISYPLL